MIDLEAVREILHADGGDVELVAIDGGTVHLRLLLADAGCAECVLPRPQLEGMVLGLLRRETPDVTGVHIDDPREDQIGSR